VVPVRAFPIAAPAEGLSLIAADGKEALWVARMADLQPEHRQLIEQDLAVREFVPTIERILKVSSFPPQHLGSADGSRPDADGAQGRGRHPQAGRSHPAADHEPGWRAIPDPDSSKLDRHSRKLLERFL
jgi:hypothetical protein